MHPVYSSNLLQDPHLFEVALQCLVDIFDTLHGPERVIRRKTDDTSSHSLLHSIIIWQESQAHLPVTRSLYAHYCGDRLQS